MKPIRTHTFNGHRVIIDIDPDGVNGMVDCPYGTNPTSTMHILKDPRSKEGFEVVVHETLHVLRWAETEEVVERTAKELVKFLWRLGYRMKGD